MNVSLSQEETVKNALETFEAAKTTFETAVKNLEKAADAEASANNVNPFVINALETVKAAKTALDTATLNLTAAEAAEAAEAAAIARVVDAADAPETSVITSNARTARSYTNRCINAYKAADRCLIVAKRDLRTAQYADAEAKKRAKEEVISAKVAFNNAVKSLVAAKEALRAAKNVETSS